MCELSSAWLRPISSQRKFNRWIGFCMEILLFYEPINPETLNLVTMMLLSFWYAYSDVKIYTFRYQICQTIWSIWGLEKHEFWLFNGWWWRWGPLFTARMKLKRWWEWPSFGCWANNRSQYKITKDSHYSIYVVSMK